MSFFFGDNFAELFSTIEQAQVYPFRYITAKVFSDPKNEYYRTVRDVILSNKEVYPNACYIFLFGYIDLQFNYYKRIVYDLTFDPSDVDTFIENIVPTYVQAIARLPVTNKIICCPVYSPVTDDRVIQQNIIRKNIKASDLTEDRIKALETYSKRSWRTMMTDSFNERLVREAKKYEGLKVVNINPLISTSNGQIKSHFKVPNKFSVFLSVTPTVEVYLSQLKDCILTIKDNIKYLHPKDIESQDKIVPLYELINNPVDEYVPRKVFTSYDSAYNEIIKDFEGAHFYRPDPIIEFESYQLPREIDGPWKLNKKALDHTLRYIMEKLHHNSYILSISKTYPSIYKLDHSTTSPSFKKYLTSNIDKRVSEPVRKAIRSRIEKQKEWRVMQCILKKYTIEDERLEMYRPYLVFLRKFTRYLPDGLFVLNIKDAVLLRKDHTEPWPMVTGRKRLGEYDFPTHIPILSCSGKKGYWDIPIPTYDDVMFVLETNVNDFSRELTIDWTKKVKRAVFRGGITGCGRTPETNQRIKLAQMRSKILDVGIVSDHDPVIQYSLKFDPKYGLGETRTNLRPVSRLTYPEQSKYKYVIHVDGNVAAYRLLKTMLFGSLILRVESDYTLWADTMLKPYEHYVPIKSDLSDLHQKIDWCMTHDTQCREIAFRGMTLAHTMLTKEYIEKSFSSLLFSLVSKAT